MPLADESGLIKRTVYVNDGHWLALKDYYRTNGLDMSKAIRKYMETDLRRLHEQGVIEDPAIKL